MKTKLMMGFVLCFFCAVGMINAKDKGTDSDTATRIVTAAYQDLLGRKPDDAGMRVFRTKMVDEGWDEKTVRDTLKQTDEYKLVNAERIIKNAYQELLGRKPDDAARRLFTQKITKEGWGEKEVRQSLLDTQEYKERNKGKKNK